MFGRAISYTAGGGRRNARTLPVLVAATALAALVAGCSAGLPLGERKAGRSPAVALAAPKPDKARLTAIEEVDPSDWEEIRREIAASSEVSNQTLDWRNPDTGSTGTITLLAAISKSGILCRSFTATVSDVKGVRRYGGEACLRTDGRWQLYAVTADDSLAA